MTDAAPAQQESTALTVGQKQVRESTAAMITVIADAAKNKDVEPARLRELLELQREYLRDQAVMAFNQDFEELEKKMPRVPKNGIIDLGGKGKIPFAKWEDMDTLIRPLLQQFGFSLSFDTEERTGGFIVIGILTHTAGHKRIAKFPVVIDTGPGRNNIQAMGSALSYGKRYVTEMLLNIVRAGEDDDGVRDGTEYITPGQAADLDALIKEVGTDRQSFLDMIGVRDVTEVTKAEYPITLNLLHAKKSAIAKKAQQQGAGQ